MSDPIPPGHGEPEPVSMPVQHRDGPAWRPAPDRQGEQLGVEVVDHDEWPVHEPECFDAPIPGRQWYGGCEPGGDWDSELGRYTGTGPRVNPATGICEGCGAVACRECGRENCPDHPNERNDMTDMTITVDGELMVAHIEAENGDATEFIDAFVPKREGAEMSVVDSGRIMLHSDDVDAFVAEAREDGFEVEVEKRP